MRGSVRKVVELDLLACVLGLGHPNMFVTTQPMELPCVPRVPHAKACWTSNAGF
jgi:hypothetical protein